MLFRSPMVSGTGEAPSGIVCYESDGFPEDYLGTLLVGSWGDHRIDKFVLKPRGASFESFPQPVIKGGENFRPVGLALAPDGSLYVTDWVLKDYKLHGKGRVWRVSAKEEPRREVVDAMKLVSPVNPIELRERLSAKRLDIRRRTANQASKLPETMVAMEKMLADKSLDRRAFEEGVRFIGTHRDTRELGEEHRHLAAMNWMRSDDPFTRRAAVYQMTVIPMDVDRLAQWFVDHTENEANLVRRANTMEVATLVLRESHPKSARLAGLAIKSLEPLSRRIAVQWIGEENLKELRPEVEKVLASEPMTNDLFMACLASLSMLDGVPPAEFEKAPPVQHVLPIVKDAQRSASLRATALRMLSPTLKELDAKLLGEMVASQDESLRREAVRTLAHSPIPERDELLRPIAADESLDVNLRADAVAGLAPVDHHAKLNDATRDLLVKLVRGKNESLGVEAARSLRGAAMAKADQVTFDAKTTDALKKLAGELKIEEPEDSRPPLGEAGKGLRPRLREAVAFAIGKRSTEKPSVDQPSTLDHQPSADAGRRVFFHTNGAGCFKCHTVGGRGGQVGPDLTVIARTMDRQKLAESILEPSKEISPQFTTWAVETTSGKVLTGMLLGEEVNGDLRLGDNTGKVFFVPFNDIETRQPLKTSIMPEKLHEQMTPTEFRDLIAYLETLK